MTSHEERVIAPRAADRLGGRQSLSSRARGYLFLLPAALAMGLVILYPVVRAIIGSFLLDGEFVAFDNFRDLFADPVFWHSLVNNLIILVNIPLGIAIALLVAAVLFRGIRGRRLYQLIVFLPFIPSIAAVGVVFIYLLNIDGPINGFLRLVGLGAFTHGWLTDPRFTIWTIMTVVLWTRVGFIVLLFMARLLSIDWELFQAAFVDGASWYRAFWHIALPELRGPIEFAAILGTIEGFSWSFAYVYVLSGGARDDWSSILEIYLYRQEFVAYLPGLASAVAVVLLLIASVLALFRYRQMKSEIRL